MHAHVNDAACNIFMKTTKPNLKGCTEKVELCTRPALCKCYHSIYAGVLALVVLVHQHGSAQDADGALIDRELL